MRDIKFRAWSDSQKIMFPGIDIETLHFLDVEGGLGIAGLALNFDFKNLQWDQFTGLKDKIGKDIYEGDIIAINDPACDGVVFVAFEGGGFVLRQEDERSWLNNYPITNKNNIEVIGNIHENPELLKEAN
jgi:uncharacterized phage protein (TIGR01671 family)